MTTKIRPVEWVVQCTMGAKSYLAANGGFTPDIGGAKKFAGYLQAEAARKGLKTPTQIIQCEGL